jgi:hypothetical protein
MRILHIYAYVYTILHYIYTIYTHIHIYTYTLCTIHIYYINPPHYICYTLYTLYTIYTHIPDSFTFGHFKVSRLQAFGLKVRHLYTYILLYTAYSIQHNLLIKTINPSYNPSYMLYYTSYNFLTPPMTYGIERGVDGQAGSLYYAHTGRVD